MQIITDQDDFEIQPWDINASVHFFDAFEHNETEVSAGYIVRLCQEKGGWFPFTHAEIEAFYQKAGRHDGFAYNRLVEPGWAFSVTGGRYLIGGGWIVLADRGKYYAVTEDFIRRCHNSSPVQ